ncbi:MULTISPECIES: bifunctional DNA primase/polymerase [Streptomycetaceae]|nr:bifunctional DNA primase/polymerase [Streptantibioticus cattleyicolor]
MTRRGVQWLSAAADDPEACRACWADDPRLPYPLATGTFFDVVVIDQRLGIETFGQLDRHKMPVGPVFMDWGATCVGFFLPHRSRERFARFLARETDDPPEYRYLDEGSSVVVPGPMPMPTDRHQWLRAPIGRPEVSPLRAVALAVMSVAAAELIAAADRYGRDHPNVEAAYAEEWKRVNGHALR